MLSLRKLGTGVHTAAVFTIRMEMPTDFSMMRSWGKAGIKRQPSKPKGLHSALQLQSPPPLQRRQMSVITSLDLTEADLHLARAATAFEPRSDIVPISRTHRQIDLAMHAAAPAMAAQLVSVSEKVAKGLN